MTPNEEVGETPASSEPGTPTLRDVVEVFDGAYDPAWAEDWDAVGTVTGHPDQPVRRILFAVDPTDAVVDEAIGLGAELIVTHHPLLLRGVHTVAASTPKGRIVTALIEHGIALHTAHTNADVADPGVNDALADVLGLVDTRPLSPMASTEGEVERLDKVVVFVPRDDTTAVLDAMAAAGAGAIGAYDRCAWSTPGHGTFRPLEGAHPTIGAVGRIEHVDEDRLEMVLPRSRRAEVVAALRAAHPYEEPAFDLIELAPDPSRDPSRRRGLGRIGRLPAPEPLTVFADRVTAALPATAHGVRVAGDPDRPIEHVAVCGGAGDSLLDLVRSTGVDAYLTADLRHHPATETTAYDGAPALVDVAHWASEWPWLAQAAEVTRTGLAARGASVDTHISTVVTDVWTLHRGDHADARPDRGGAS